MVGRIPSNKRGGPAPIPVIDLFAGPGGLGEGFSSLGDPTSPVFQIRLSAEMEPAAHKTLLLRAYYRALVRTDDRKLIQRYYDFCNGNRDTPYDEKTLPFWEEADAEALNLTLGEAGSDRKLNGRLDKFRLAGAPWVLIGGPPCQAYSLVGRSRNRGKESYKAEEDNRHYLYREYLKIIQRYSPAVFVMENVKGLLSSKVGDDLIFHAILRDLADPDLALGVRGKGIKYRIHSLISNQCYEHDRDPQDIDSGGFVLRAEEHGIPQSRHRVILVGVQEGFAAPSYLTRLQSRVSVGGVVDALPSLRSSISKQIDNYKDWAQLLHRNAGDLSKLARRAGQSEVADQLDKIVSRVRLSRSTGGLRVPGYVSAHQPDGHLKKWLHDHRLRVWLNHEARGHMQTDLRRYLYAAAFANAHERSPKGHSEFDLDGLAPDHHNWKSGKFADRFRVQVRRHPATTITSHISKDGHYYIHPDPVQCRSLTVREAARIQTFPDNYFFQGNRTHQFVQVGNAVPPFLARQIACVVAGLLGRNESSDILDTREP